MAGSKAERGGPGPLHHLGERLFGYGRKFGIQMGPIEQRVYDPYTRSSDIVTRYWGSFIAHDISPSQLRYAHALLAKRVNDGTADTKLIPSIEAIVMRTIPDHTPNHTPHHTRDYTNVDQLSDYQGLKEDPRSIFYLYHHIISRAETAETIPYLLQALNSSFVVRGNQPTQTDRQRRTPTEPGHHLYSMVQHWNAYYPFANQAKVRLRDIIHGMSDSRITNDVEEAIAHFDTISKKEITTTARSFS